MAVLRPGWTLNRYGETASTLKNSIVPSHIQNGQTMELDSNISAAPLALDANPYLAELSSSDKLPRTTVAAFAVCICVRWAALCGFSAASGLLAICS